MKAIIAAILPLILPGCSLISYQHTYPDGQSYRVYGIAFGTTKSIEDFELQAGTDKRLTIGKYGADQTQAIQAAVEGAVKAAIASAKP